MSACRIALLGDVMLGRGVAEQMAQRSPESFWGDTLAVLRAQDLVIANLECAITTHPLRWTRTPKVFHFRAPPAATEVLRAAGIRLVSLANNHILDYEEQGLRDTLAHLDAAGIAWAGAGPKLATAARPAVVAARGVRIGLVAFTDNEPEWEAHVDRPGTNYLPIEMTADVLRRVEHGIAAARQAGAELVIVSLHWGPNMVLRPPADFREFARATIHRGADVVYGHSAHLFQGVEVHAGRPILYDTGDFLDDYAVHDRLRNDWSFIFVLDAAGGAVRTLELVPVRLRFTIVNLARGAEARAILERMEGLCAELGTTCELPATGYQLPATLRITLGAHEKTR